MARAVLATNGVMTPTRRMPPSAKGSELGRAEEQERQEDISSIKKPLTRN